MADTLARLRVNLAGWDGAPGVNTWYFSAGTGGSWLLANLQEACDVVNDMYVGIHENLVPGMTVSPDPAVSYINIASGELVGVETLDNSGWGTTGAGSSGAESRATQATCAFLTDRFINGRRLQGRVFLGPLASGSLDGSGLITTGTQSGIPPLLDGIISGTGARLAVYQRPKPGVGGSGDYGDVTSIVVRPKPGILRSRRD